MASAFEDFAVEDYNLSSRFFTDLDDDDVTPTDSGAIYNDDFFALIGFIVQYISPILLLLGTAGNIVSVFVLRRLSHEVLSTCIYLAVLAVLDTIVLYVHCGNSWILHITEVDLNKLVMDRSESVCKAYPFALNFVEQMSQWLIAATATEGLIASSYPHNTITLCTLSRAKAVIMLVTVLLVCVNIHYFWSFELVDEIYLPFPDSIRCTFAKHGHQQSEYFQEQVWPILQMAVTATPYIFVLFCSAAMLKTVLTGQHRGSSAYRDWRRRYLLDPDAVEQIVVTLLAVCLTCILLTLPKHALLIFPFISQKIEFFGYIVDFFDTNFLAQTIVEFSVYVFLSCKFLLYISIARRFRHETTNLCRFCCCCCGRRAKQDGMTMIGDNSEELMKQDGIIVVGDNSEELTP